MALDFTPQFHFKNGAGQWQYRPVNPRLMGAVAEEALRLRAAGEPMAPVIDADPASSSPFFDALKQQP